jgi:hypothetical protein
MSEQSSTTLKRQLKSYNYSYNAINKCSIDYIRSFDTKFKGYESSFIVGGRCHNEQPHITRAEDLIDLDIQSCYGAVLSDFQYPIGPPFLYQVNVNEILTLLTSP